jgi:hypothetical protein
VLSFIRGSFIKYVISFFIDIGVTWAWCFTISENSQGGSRDSHSGGRSTVVENDAMGFNLAGVAAFLVLVSTILRIRDVWKACVNVHKFTSKEDQPSSSNLAPPALV